MEIRGHVFWSALAVCLVLGILVAGECPADVPTAVSYQGKLSDSAGWNADGVYNMAFSLFSQESGGTALWTESRSVQVADGLFTVLLGSLTPLPATVFAGTTWLETQVNGVMLAPRVQIVSTGYAMRAQVAEGVTDGAISSTKLADGAVTTSKLADASVSSAKIADLGVDVYKLAPNAVTSGKILDFTVTAADLASYSVTAPKLAPDALAYIHSSDSVFNVKDYGALGDGTTDNSAAFQNALNAAEQIGGGVVFVPVGNYKIAGHINIPSHVTLEGVWRIPTAWSQYKGSTLLATEGKGSASGTPFITMWTNSTVKGITIYYPEQSNTAPAAYPWTFSSRGDNCSILDVLLVNPYQGVDFSTSASGRHLIRNLHGQPLYRGIVVSKCYDIGRIENVHFWPFWDQGLLSWTKANGVAFQFGRTDWQYVLNTFCLGYKIGYQFLSTPEGTCNGNFVGIGADACGYAVWVDSAAPFGILITNGEFVADQGDRSVAIKVVGTMSSDGVVNLNNCAFWGTSYRICESDGGNITFNSCNFRDWGKNGGDYAIVTWHGRVTVSNCFFATSGRGVFVDSGMTGGIITGNQGLSAFSEIYNAIGSRCSIANNVP